MTAKAKETPTAAQAADEKPPTTGTPPADPEEVVRDVREQAAAARERMSAKETARGECVVKDGTPHMGRAVNGVICSAHAMNYKSDGTRR
jgi:hypothetical protein